MSIKKIFVTIASSLLVLGLGITVHAVPTQQNLAPKANVTQAYNDGQNGPSYLTKPSVSYNDILTSQASQDELGGLYDGNWIRFDKSKLSVGIDPKLAKNPELLAAAKQAIQDWNTANTVKLVLKPYKVSDDIVLTKTNIKPLDRTNRPASRVVINTTYQVPQEIQNSEILFDPQNAKQTLKRLNINPTSYYDHEIEQDMGRALGLRFDKDPNSNNVMGNNPTSYFTAQDGASLKGLYRNLDQ